MKLCAGLLVVFSLGAANAQAALNSEQRLHALAKLPDWSGVWEVEGSTATIDPSGMPPPYTPAFQSTYERTRAKLPHLVDSEQRVCAAGVPRLMASPEYFEAMVTPEQTTLVFSGREVRHIYTDGTPHTDADELWPMYWGDSVGHWEGDTLIADTVSILGKQWLDATGATLSDKAHIVERISMPDHDHLQDHITITDPDALTRPWVFTRVYKRSTRRDMTDVVCNWHIGTAQRFTR